MNSHSENLHHSPLGKQSDYVVTYSPDLLFPIPRQPKRDDLGIDNGHLPFTGIDIWTAYELSWLDSRGKPVVYVARFELPAISPNIIESKSFKLYLNSFNQSQFKSADEVKACLEQDLSRVAEAPVKVELLSVAALEKEALAMTPGFCVDDLPVAISRYDYEPALLEGAAEEGDVVTETLHSHLLKSNCPVTGQPDWGTLVIEYRGQPINREKLLQYICSFRSHSEFHEQCVERAFLDISRYCKPESLCVYARYVRRGGLDINPYRSSAEMTYLQGRLARQ